MKFNSSTINSAVEQIAKTKKGRKELTNYVINYRLNEAQHQGFSRPKAIKLYREFLKLSKIFH